MAASALTPRVRIMVICDGIRESVTEPGVFNLKGVRQSKTAPAFPYVPAKLWLFVLLSSPRPGQFPGYIRVIDELSDRVIFHGHLEPRPTFASVGGWCEIGYPLRCRFPRGGAYSVQLWFFQEQGNDILKGELPFFIADEES